MSEENGPLGPDSSGVGWPVTMSSQMDRTSKNYIRCWADSGDYKLPFLEVYQALGFCWNQASGSNCRDLHDRNWNGCKGCLGTCHSFQDHLVQAKDEVAERLRNCIGPDTGEDSGLKIGPGGGNLEVGAELEDGCDDVESWWQFSHSLAFLFGRQE